jgi:hypothetical protein
MSELFRRVQYNVQVAERKPLMQRWACSRPFPSSEDILIPYDKEGKLLEDREKVGSKSASFCPAYVTQNLKGKGCGIAHKPCYSIFFFPSQFSQRLS